VPVAVAGHRPVDRAEHPYALAPDVPADLTAVERELLADLFAIVSEHADEVAESVDRERVVQAFTFACEHHADQRRRSGEEFIVHPVGVAKICAGMRLDTETLCAALLHDTVEDTSASLDEVREAFGDEVAGLVDGVTKLTGITFQSRDEAQAENYRKMMVAMATDIRVILIKLADRLHNMRTLEAMAKQKQIEKAKETLEIYAPLAHRLGIHAIKWELEDLAFSTLHPRKYQEIKGLVNQQREEREHYVARAGGYLAKELEALGIHAEISGRAKHFYSIYSKMTRKGREFNEIYDLTAMRVIVDSVKDSAVDPTDIKLKWLKSVLDWQTDEDDPREFTEHLRGELIEDEVYVFTPKGEVKSLAAGATPLDFAYEIHTDVGHRCVGAKVNGKIVPLHYELASGDIVEILTAKRERGPSRDWLALVKTTRARNKIRQWFKAESRDDSEHTGRELLQEHLTKAGLPAQRITGSPLLADVIREMGFRKADDFYIALGGAKISPKVVVNKVLQRLKQGESAEAEMSAAEDLLKPTIRRKPEAPSSKFGIRVEGVDDVPLRLAKCCRPVSGDPIVGYVSLGRGITIHREDCPNAVALRKDPERFVPVSWDGDNETSFKVEIQVDAWDRHRLLEDLSRTFAEGGINIVEAYCSVQHPMVKNRFVIEVGDTQALKTAINRLRAIDSVFDAYRVIPSGG
jgi:(p)ppGpp synthase/HD superfamily hydrolase